MATDYREVLKELRAEEQKLEAEIATIRSMIPGAEVMAARMPAPIPPPVWLAPGQQAATGIFSGMQVKEAILSLLTSSMKPLMPSDITKALSEGNVQTRSSDLAGLVTSTLNQMKDDIERSEGGWRLRQR